jgi:hypothetical protein
VGVSAFAKDALNRKDLPMTRFQKIFMPVAAAALFSVPVTVWAQQQDAPATPVVSAPATGDLTKDQLKEQKKTQKAQEKAAKDNAKAAKEQSKAVQHQNKATNAAEKSKSEQPTTATPQ